MLSTTRNLNAGWKATLDGKPLRPMISDGWAQAWRLPAGDGGRLEITYGPQLSYLVSLYGGLAVAAFLLVGALVLLLRTRLRPARQVPDLVRPAPSLRSWVLVAIVALPVSWVLGGLPALLGVAIGASAVLLGRRRLGQDRGGSVLVAAYAVAAWALRDSPHLRVDAADFLAGTGFVLVVASLVPRPARMPRVRREP